jgi:hypothetical protein
MLSSTEPAGLVSESKSAPGCLAHDRAAVKAGASSELRACIAAVRAGEAAGAATVAVPRLRNRAEARVRALAIDCVMLSIPNALSHGASR